MSGNEALEFTWKHNKQNNRIQPAHVYDDLDFDLQTFPNEYEEFDNLVDILVHAASADKLLWFDENRKSKRIAKFLSILSVVLGVIFLLYTHGAVAEGSPVRKTEIQAYLMGVMPQVAQLHQKIKNVENTPQYINFAMSKDKKKTYSDDNHLRIMRHMLKNFPKCPETDNLLAKVEQWSSNPDTLSTEEKKQIEKAVYFSCSEMKTTMDKIDCDTMLSWDDYAFMRQYNIYLTEDIIPEMRKGTEFFQEVCEKMWKSLKLDSYIYTLDNLRHHSYAYTILVLFSRSELPVVLLTYELFDFMKIASTTAQHIVLYHKYSLYYELTVTNGATYLLSLFIGYGIVYVPIVLALVCLYVIYTPFNILNIIYHRCIVSVHKAAAVSDSVIVNGSSVIFTSRIMSAVICIRQYLLYMKSVIKIVIVSFVVSNIVSLLIALSFGTYYYDADSVFSVWSYELIRMYDNIYNHLETSVQPLAAIVMYTVYWFLTHFGVVCLFKLCGRICSCFASRPNICDRKDSAIFVLTRCLFITVMNVTAWTYGYGQIVEILWNNMFKALLPVSHIIQNHY